MSELSVPKYYRLPCSTCGTIWQVRLILQPGELAPRACNYWEDGFLKVKLPCKHWQNLMGVLAIPKPVQIVSNQTRVLG